MFFHANNKGADQTAHMTKAGSLISLFSHVCCFMCYRGSASAVGSSVNMPQRNPTDVLSSSQMGTGRFMLDKVIKIWDVSSLMKQCKILQYYYC